MSKQDIALLPEACCQPKLAPTITQYLKDFSIKQHIYSTQEGGKINNVTNSIIALDVTLVILNEPARFSVGSILYSKTIRHVN